MATKLPIHFFGIALVCLALAGAESGHPVGAAPRTAKPATAHSASASSLTPDTGDPGGVRAFEAHLVQEANALRESRTSPEPLQKELMNKLQTGAFVTNKGMMAVLGTWSMYESPGYQIPGRRDAQGHLFPGSRALITLLMPYSYGRDDLKLKLYEAEGQFAEIDKDPKTEDAALKNAEAIVTPLYTNYWLRYDTVCTERGDLLSASGNIPDAITEYANVLIDDSFYVSLSDHDRVTQQGDLYLQAGRGLINCRRGDVPMLQHTFFSEYVRKALDPVRDAAIRDAGGTPVPDPVITVTLAAQGAPAAAK